MSEKITSWVDHLEELRKRLIYVGIFLSVSFIGGLFIHKQLIDVLTRPLKALGLPLYFTAPTEGFMIVLKASLFFAIFVTFPFVLWHLWQFVRPGLHPKERKAVFPMFTISLLLFLVGASFAYFLVLPTALRFLLSFGSAHFQPLLSVGRYSSFAAFMIISFGISFNLPLVLIALAQLNIVSAPWLRHIRKFVILGIFIFAAIITPSPDALSQILLGVPMLILFEATIIVVSLVEKRRKAPEPEKIDV